jgi:hypothetical protein
MSTCEFCGEPFPGWQSRNAREWSWFTGRLDRTVHFCPSCKDERAYQIAGILQLAQKHEKGGARYNADLAIAFAGATFRHAEEVQPWQTEAAHELHEPDERAVKRAAALAWSPGETRGEYRRNSFAAWCGD